MGLLISCACSPASGQLVLAGSRLALVQVGGATKSHHMGVATGKVKN